MTMVQTTLAVAAAPMSEPTRKHIAALIADIRGFTSFSETVEPEILFAAIRDFHAAMGEAIQRASGTVVNFAGDAFLVVFNGPIDVPDPERRAVQAALDMQRRFAHLAETWAKQGYHLSLRIGIHAGFATLGPIGFPGRYELGAIGRTVNTAGRLCAEAGPGSVLISARLASELGDSFVLGPSSEVLLRGLTRPLSVVEVQGGPPE